MTGYAELGRAGVQSEILRSAQNDMAGGLGLNVRTITRSQSTQTLTALLFCERPHSGAGAVHLKHGPESDLALQHTLVGGVDLVERKSLDYGPDVLKDRKPDGVGGV